MHISNVFCTGIHVITFLLILFDFSGEAQTAYTNKKLGYSLMLPENWYALNTSDSQDIFFDVSSSGRTYLSVVRHKIDTNTTETYWTKFHFLMYISTTQEWEDPWGTILALDSSQDCTIDGGWAPQAFAQFFSLDSINSTWSEYIIFTARYGGGYELYAIGDTLDLKTKGAAYSQILNSVTFSQPSSIKINRKVQSFEIISGRYEQGIFDLSGRSFSSFPLNKRRSTVVIIKNRDSFINFR